MKRSVICLLYVLVLSVAGGCGGGDRSAGEKKQPAEGTFDPLVQSIDRAKQVEQITKDRVRQLNERIEDAEKGTEKGPQ